MAKNDLVALREKCVVGPFTEKGLVVGTGW